MQDCTETKLLMAALNDDEEKAFQLIMEIPAVQRAELRRAMEQIDEWITAVELFGETGDDVKS